MKKLQEAALAGDVQAARTLLERALPVYRASAEPVQLPGLNDTQALTDKAHAVLAAVADGSIPPDLGAQLVTAIGTVARVAEVDELARRIAALEEHHGKPQDALRRVAVCRRQARPARPGCRRSWPCP